MSELIREGSLVPFSELYLETTLFAKTVAVPVSSLVVSNS
jgi:hypothetical protein